MSTSGAPAVASISASAMVAHLCRVTPASSSMRAISRVLCVLTCGRRRSGPPAISITRAMFRRMSAGKNTSDGLNTLGASDRAYSGFMEVSGRLISDAPQKRCGAATLLRSVANRSILLALEEFGDLVLQRRHRLADLVG